MPRLWMTLVGLTSALLGARAASPEPPPRQVGPFEIRAHVRKVGDSGRFLRTGNPLGTTRVREYSVTWRGTRVRLPVGGDRFWQVLQLPEAPRPALLVAAGPKLYLLSELNGRLETQALAPESGSDSYQWLDSVAGQPGPEVKGFGLDPADAPATTVLSGGRWLYLHHRLVLDTRTLATVAVEPWAREGDGENVVEMNASNSPALAFSPGQTRFVLAGEGRDYRKGGERFDLLLVIDLATGKAEGRRLEPAVVRDQGPLGYDAAWLARHFRWEPTGAGPERLVPR